MCRRWSWFWLKMLFLTESLLPARSLLGFREQRRRQSKTWFVWRSLRKRTIHRIGVLWAFFVPKANGVDVRMVTDFSKINKFVKRPVHPFPSVADIIRSIPAGTKFFAKMDTIQGYFQLALDEDSSKSTTFLLPTGRYRYLRAPMGLSSSSDEWCRH